MASHLFRGLKMQRRSLEFIPRITSALVNSTQKEETSVDLDIANKSAGEFHKITTPPVPVRLVQRFMFSSWVKKMKKKVKATPFVCIECLDKNEVSEFCSPYTLSYHQHEKHPSLCRLNIRCHRCFLFFKNEQARDSHICVMEGFENYMECVASYQRILDEENKALEAMEQAAREEAEKAAEKKKAEEKAKKDFDKEFDEELKKEARENAEKKKAEEKAKKDFDKEFDEELEKEARENAEKKKAEEKAKKDFDKEFDEELEKEARENAEKKKAGEKAGEEKVDEAGEKRD